MRLNSERNSILWGIRTNDEGVANPKSYYSLVNSGNIKVVAPARAIGYDKDGASVNLNNGEKVAASVVILATGWKSSWTDIFDGMCGIDVLYDMLFTFVSQIKLHLS